MIIDGRLTAADQVFREGLADWRPVAATPELRELLSRPTMPAACPVPALPPPGRQLLLLLVAPQKFFATVPEHLSLPGAWLYLLLPIWLCGLALLAASRLESIVAFAWLTLCLFPLLVLLLTLAAVLLLVLAGRFQGGFGRLYRALCCAHIGWLPIPLILLAAGSDFSGEPGPYIFAGAVAFACSYFLQSCALAAQDGEAQLGAPVKVGVFCGQVPYAVLLLIFWGIMQNSW